MVDIKYLAWIKVPKPRLNLDLLPSLKIFVVCFKVFQRQVCVANALVQSADHVAFSTTVFVIALQGPKHLGHDGATLKRREGREETDGP